MLLYLFYLLHFLVTFNLILILDIKFSVIIKMLWLIIIKHYTCHICTVHICNQYRSYLASLRNKNLHSTKCFLLYQGQIVQIGKLSRIVPMAFQPIYS